MPVDRVGVCEGFPSLIVSRPSMRAPVASDLSTECMIHSVDKSDATGAHILGRDSTY